MMGSAIQEEILEQVKQLNILQQRKVLDFARALVITQKPRGESGKSLLKFLETFEMDPDDLRAMEQAIEEDCERIDDSEW